MTYSLSDPRSKFLKLIGLEKSRTILEPKLVFLCGGQVDATKTTNHSIRNMFMNLSAAVEAHGVHDFVLAENFKDWKDGYSNLSDFENDIAYVSSLVVIILESEGSLTEFGLFFANTLLRKKLVAVVHDEHYDSESFIKFGLLNPLQELAEEQVRAYQINHADIENVSEDEVKDIVSDISQHCRNSHNSEQFDPNNRGHQIFLIFQILDFFLALTISEIDTYLAELGLQFAKKDIKSALYILQKFHLIGARRKSAQTFYFAYKAQPMRVDFHLADKNTRFDQSALRIQVLDFYRDSSKADPSFKRRVKVIEAIPEKAGPK